MLEKPYLADWWYVNKTQVPDSLYSFLTISVNKNDCDETEEIPVWSEVVDENNNPVICFPRYCDYGKIIFNSGDFIDGRTSGEPIEFNMLVEPRDKYQKSAISAILATEHGICQAKTAFGKTYVAINVISKLKVKALILVHKTPLAEQWKKDILAYTDLKEDDIEILKGKKFKLDKPIVISTVQNFVAKNNHQQWELRDKIISANFGVTFFDECHVTSGPLAFVQSSRWFASKRIYGLSATPMRGDNIDKMIHWAVGNVIYKDERPMMPVYVTHVPIHCPVPYKTLNYFQYVHNDYMRRYLMWFCEKSEYKDAATKLIVDLIKRDKKVLAVGAYKFLLDLIYESVKNKLIEENIPVAKIILCHGTSDTKVFDLNSSMHSCIISTNKYFSDGLSVAWLDTLVYLSPPSAKSMVNIPQIVGRIVRSYEGKEYVTVYDIYNDQYDVENGRRIARDRKYKEYGYNIIESKTTEYANEFEDNVKAIEGKKKEEE